jgi:hypothetical protein
MILFNPNQRSRHYQDSKTDQLMQATIDFFEGKGLKQIKRDWHERKWNHDYVDFLKDKQVFATLMTPAGYGAADSRWDIIATAILGNQCVLRMHLSVHLAGLHARPGADLVRVQRESGNAPRSCCRTAPCLPSGFEKEHGPTSIPARWPAAIGGNYWPTAASITSAMATRRRWFPPGKMTDTGGMCSLPPNRST